MTVLDLSVQKDKKRSQEEICETVKEVMDLSEPCSPSTLSYSGVSGKFVQNFNLKSLFLSHLQNGDLTN